MDAAATSTPADVPMQQLWLEKVKVQEAQATLHLMVKDILTHGKDDEERNSMVMAHASALKALDSMEQGLFQHVDPKLYSARGHVLASLLNTQIVVDFTQMDLERDRASVVQRLPPAWQSVFTLEEALMRQSLHPPPPQRAIFLHLCLHELHLH